MAERVWERMKDRDSKECRNCHDFKTMDTAKQKDRSVTKHEGAIEDGKTCIDCHKGIAHKPVHHLLEKDPAQAQPAAAPAAAAAPQAAASPAEAVATGAANVAKAGATAAASTATAAATAMSAASTAMTAGTGPAKATPKAEAAGATAPAAGGTVTALDWSKVPVRKIKVFYPGQASLEWVMNKPDHSSVPDIVDKKRPCAKCHEGDANDVGNMPSSPASRSAFQVRARTEADRRQGGLHAGAVPGHPRRRTRSTSASNGCRRRSASKSSWTRRTR
jgi:hypothetical protein